MNIKKANVYVRNAWIMAIISFVITTVSAISALVGHPIFEGVSGYYLMDSIIIAALGVGIYRKSLRLAVGMVIYFLFSKMIQLSGNLLGAAFGMVYLYFYVMGVIGCYYLETALPPNGDA